MEYSNQPQLSPNEGGFGFSDTHEMFRRSVRDFARKELAPGLKERLKAGKMPAEIIQKMAQMGLLGLNMPEQYGGEPADWISVGIALEEMARVDISAPLLAIGAQTMNVVLRFGSESVRQAWLPLIIRGEMIGGIALTEPDCGSDAASIRTRAVREGDYYRLNGEKTAFSWGLQANVAALFAKTDPSAGARGVSCFLVPLDLPGISRSLYEDMGWKGVGRASLTLDDVKVPAGYLLGEEGRGFSMAMGQFDFARVGLSLTALGMAQAAVEESIAYAKQRVAFGRPIAKFEAVSFKIAENVTLIEAARLLCYRTLWLKDTGHRHTKESAMCKWWCPRVALRAIHDSLLIHGHVGFSEEFAAERRLRDVIGFEMADGTAEIMKLIISRDVIEMVPEN